LKVLHTPPAFTGDAEKAKWLEARVKMEIRAIEISLLLSWTLIGRD